MNTYVIGEEIGTGGLATVYVARRKHRDGTDEFAACKVLHAKYQQNQATCEAFCHEVALTMTLSHPNIVSGYGLRRNEDNGALYYFMEYVDGCSLAEILQRERRLSVERVRAIMLGVAKGMVYLHQRSILHRDISPSNILIDPTAMGV